jgi:hypothetical protein
LQQLRVPVAVAVVHMEILLEFQELMVVLAAAVLMPQVAVQPPQDKVLMVVLALAIQIMAQAVVVEQELPAPMAPLPLVATVAMDLFLQLLVLP